MATAVKAAAVKKAKTVTAVVVEQTKKRARKQTIPLAIGLGLMPLVSSIPSDFKVGGMHEVNKVLILKMTGWNVDRKTDRFQSEWLGRGLLPLIAGFMIHKYVGKKVNPILARAGVPLFRI